MRFLLFLFLGALVSPIFSQNLPPEINNINVSFDQSNQTLTIDYDLSDLESDLIDIDFLISADGGISYPFNTDNASGDVGSGIIAGEGKSIVWDATSLLSGNGDYRVKIIANDLFQLDIQTLVDQVDSTRLLNHLNFIEGVRHRFANPGHLEEVKDTIEALFQESQLKTVREDFLFNGYTGQNIIGTKEGSHHADTIYIVDGHFDSVEDSPGADDNGSAVAGMLEALRVLAPYQFNKTIKFIGFDLEEAGLIGAFNYTNEDIHEAEYIKGVFNLEMIGYFSDEPNSQTFPTGFEFIYPDVQAALLMDEFRGNFITNIGDQNSASLQVAYNNAAANYVPALKVISLTAPPSWQSLTPDLGRSDHAAFWLKSIPALMITDGSEFRNPFYHSPNDKVETLNFTFMSNVVKAVVGAIAEEAGIQNSTFATADFSVLSSTNNELDCGLRVLTNPFDSHCELIFKSCAYKNMTLKVINTVGQTILTKSIDQNASNLKLNLEQYDSGLYFVNLQAGDQQLSRRIVKR